jgi:hypothetical protein
VKKINLLCFFGGLLLFGLVVYDLILWIQISSDQSKTMQQVTEEYNSITPSFLGRNTMAFLNILMLSISGFLFYKARNFNPLKIVCNLLAISCIALICWMVFSIM